MNVDLTPDQRAFVQRAIESVRAQTKPVDEILVVDDGSTDGTYQRCVEAFADEPRVRVFTKPNTGKPDALNFGALHTSSEIVIALDADTLFARDTISKVSRRGMVLPRSSMLTAVRCKPQ